MASSFEYALVTRAVEGSQSPGSAPSVTAYMPDGLDKSYPDRIAALNDLGKLGWELVGVTEVLYTGGAVLTNMYLKRAVGA